jgi:hypothetical protein
MRVLARLRRPVLALAAAGLLLAGLPVPAAGQPGGGSVPALPAAVSTLGGHGGSDAVVDRGGEASVLAALPAPTAVIPVGGALTVLLVLAGLAGAVRVRRANASPGAGLRVRGPPRRVPTSTPAR